MMSYSHRELNRNELERLGVPYEIVKREEEEQEREQNNNEARAEAGDENKE